MMQTYLGSYWYHFHTQLPILHQPTFAADRTPNLLLLAVMAIGAATLDKAHGQAATETAAELASFIAWHLRWEIFMVVGKGKLFVVFKGDLEVGAAGSVMKGYSPGVIEGEDGDSTGMSGFCGESSRAKLSRFCNCEPRVVCRSR